MILNRSKGFSVVELLVVMTIIVILLSIAVVAFGKYQADARDNTRKSRVENIARYLEGLYSSGIDQGVVVDPGTYPRISTLADTCQQPGCGATQITNQQNPTKIDQLFATMGFDKKNLKSADSDSYGIYVALDGSKDCRQVDTVNSAACSSNPQITPDKYLYQPIAYDDANDTGHICNLASDKCRSFNLFYMTEADQTIHKISSRHQ